MVPYVYMNTPTRRTLLISAAVIILIGIIAAAWFFLFRTGAPPMPFRIMQGPVTLWYELEGKDVTEVNPVMQEPVLEGAFSVARAEDGSLVGVDVDEGLVAQAPGGARTVLIEGDAFQVGFSAVRQDASIAVLYNSATDALDVFSLDSVRPTVLSYEGSVPAPATMSGVGFPARNLMIVRTGKSDFELFRIKDGTVTPAGKAQIGEKQTSFDLVPEAYAYTYPNPPTSNGAVTDGVRKCTGAQVATLGGSSGLLDDGHPSASQLMWGYISNTANLPGGYATPGSYCIMGYDRTNNTTWQAGYTVHSGNGTTATGGYVTGGTVNNPTYTTYYTLTYVSTPSVTLGASPTTIDSGSSAALTWSSSNVSSCTGTNFSTGGATSGTVSVSPTTTTTYSISCTGSNGTATDSRTVTVLQRPNLVASAPSLSPGSSVTAGTSITYSATVTNSGAAAASASTLGIIARKVSDQTQTFIGQVSIGALSASGSAPGSYSYAITSPGSYEVRACADYTNTNSESNESDNCSAWVPVTVSAAPVAPVTASLTATPNPLTLGSSATLTWSSTNANTCQGSGFLTGGATSGSVSVSPTATTEYFVTCYGSSGSGGSGSSWTGGEWWTGGTQTEIYHDTLWNNGQQGGVCATAAGDAYWNATYKNYPYRCGDEGCSLIEITCYSVVGPTGTVSKPSESGGICTVGSTSCYEITYFRSGTPGSGGSSSDSWESASVTVTVNAAQQCLDGTDNDGDGFTDLNDPSCYACSSGTCPPGTPPLESDPVATVSCTVDTASVDVGGSTTYRTQVSNGATSPYTWHPSAQTNCSGSSTQTCTFPQASEYTMTVNATGAPAPASCPNVTAGCAGTQELSLEPAETRVKVGQSTTLTPSGSAINATTCSLTGTNGLNVTLTPNACMLSGSPVSTGAITTQTFFTLTCGSESNMVIVNVSSNPIEI